MKKRLVSLLVVLAMTLSFVPVIAGAAASIEIGEYLQMGTYYGEPILWRCVDIDENGPLMLSDKIICIKPFDAKGDNTSGSHGRGYDDGYFRKRNGSNYWADSNMRCWLNSTASAGNVDWTCGNPPTEDKVSNGYNEYADEAGFLTNFSQGERNAVKSVTQKSLLDGFEHDSNNKNKNYHRCDSDIYDVVQNYDSAYSENVTDKMFLLDVKQLNTVYNNRNILGSDYYIGEPTAQAVANSEYKTSNLQSGNKCRYWLRSPDSYRDIASCGVRVVSTGGIVGFGNAYYGLHIGVRPAFYLNLSSARFTSGSGTLAAPYTVEGSGASEITPTRTGKYFKTSFVGGTDIEYNVANDEENINSFSFAGALKSLYSANRTTVNQIAAKNVKVKITLPPGYSFDEAGEMQSGVLAPDQLTSSIYKFLVTVYLQRPTAGTHDVKIHISADNMPDMDFTYQFSVTDFDFQIDQYRADYAIEKIGVTEKNSYFDFESWPCHQLKSADMDMATAMYDGVMNFLDVLNNPGNIIDYKFEEKDMYTAIILSMFENSVDYGVVDCFNNSLTKSTKDLVSTVTSMMKNIYNFDVFSDLSSLSEDDRQVFIDCLKSSFKEKHGDAAAVSKITEYIGDFLEYADDVESCIETMEASYKIISMSDSMKQVLQEMYNECPKNNRALKLALSDCIDVMNGGTEKFITDMVTHTLSIAGKDIAQFYVDKFWDGAKDSFSYTHPAAFAFQAAYSAGKYVSNEVFCADSLSEQYSKAVAVMEIEDLLIQVHNNILDKYKTNKTDFNAQVYNSVIDVVFDLLDTDCNYAVKFADTIDEALMKKILSALGDNGTDEYRNKVKGLQNNAKAYHVSILLGWVYALEDESPADYAVYRNILEDYKYDIKKKYNIACPVDVYVVDSNDIVVASVIDNVPECSDDAAITLVVEGDKKTIYFHNNEEYRLIYKGTDTGAMDIQITEFDAESETRNTNFNKIELYDGITYTSEESSKSLEENAYLIKDEKDNEIIPDYDSESVTETETYTAEIERGYFDGLETVKSLYAGEKAVVTAYVPEGYKFAGWSSDAGDIFDDSDSIITTIVMPECSAKITANIIKVSEVDATPEPSATPTETETPEPSATPTETETPEPSATPTETETPEPSATPTETETPEPSVSPTETPEPSAMPTETATPEPSATPTETETPEPSVSPTETPEPSAMPTETATPEPSATPTAEYTINDITVENGTVSVNLTNTSGTGATLITASYAENGTLIGVAFEDIILPDNTADNVDVALNTDGVAYVTVFIWDSITSMQPICESKRYNIK